MIKIVDGEEVEMTPEEISEWESLSTAPHLPVHRLYKSTMVRRLTDEEAVTLKGVLETSSVKLQMIWAASEWLDNSDPLFVTLKTAITQALGVVRADEVLREEDPVSNGATAPRVI